MITSDNQHKDTEEFDQLSEAVRMNLDSADMRDGPLFHTSAADSLFKSYLAQLDPTVQQEHRCYCCQSFLQRYGSLAYVTKDGSLRSALWSDDDNVPQMYKAAVNELRRMVERSVITKPFLHTQDILGTPEAGGWNHFFINSEGIHGRVHEKVDSLESQVAQAVERFRVLSASINGYSLQALAQAVNMFSSDKLPNASKFRGPLEALHRLKLTQGKGPTAPQKAALRWQFVQTSPPGWSTFRSGVVGELLDSFESGKPLAAIEAWYRTITDPLKYQRPEATTEGNINAAEKLIEKLGVANSLKRRYARLDELPVIWKPAQTAAQQEKAGVFGHLKTSANAPSNAPVVKGGHITLEKLRRRVLPDALSIQVFVPGNRCNLVAFTSAEDMDAPPILKWDSEEARNPVAWYRYYNGSMAREWNLKPSSFVKATALVLSPHMLHSEDGHPGEVKTAVWALDGCYPPQANELCLFPNTLTNELHSVRSTIEAYSKAGALQGREGAEGSGLSFEGSLIRVTNSVGTTEYVVDRWD